MSRTTGQWKALLDRQYFAPTLARQFGKTVAFGLLRERYEAVAEVIRLREELEQMRHFHMDMCRMEASENGNPQPYYDIAKHIDRILNPEEEA